MLGSLIDSVFRQADSELGFNALEGGKSHFVAANVIRIHRQSVFRPLGDASAGELSTTQSTWK